MLGDVLCHMGRPVDGRARLEAVLRTEPENARAHAGLGAAAARDGRLDDAVVELRKATERLPDDASAQYALGTSALRSVLQRGRAAVKDPMLDTAREALGRAVSLRPGFADALANLGRAQMIANVRLQEAFDLIAQALTLSPAHDEYRLYATEVLARQGKYAEARDLAGPILAGGASESLKTATRSFIGAIAAQENARQAAQDASDNGRTMPATASDADAARSSDTPGSARLVPLFRQTRDGERRDFGTFEAVECSPTPVALRVHAADRTLHFFVRALDKVEFMSYRDDAKGRVRCGTQNPVFAVWVTWRAIEGTSPRGGPFDGEVVAVEIVPKDYAPPERR
jgi:Flp pilus assembly protein TadD